LVDEPGLVLVVIDMSIFSPDARSSRCGTAGSNEEG